MYSFLPASIIILFSRCILCEDFSAHAGIHFKETLTNQGFFSSVPAMVSYSVAIDGLPDMPRWMKLLHNKTSPSAIMYGTPPVTDIGKIMLSVVAWNKDSYETAIKTINLSVTTLDTTSIKYQVEFKVDNRDISEMINDCDNFLAAVQTSIWSEAAYVVRCESMSDHTNINPIPGQKEGVYIVVGGKDSPSNVTILKRNCKNVASTTISTTNNYFLGNGFVVDWCALNYVTRASFESSKDGADETDLFLQPKLQPLESFADSHQTLTSDVVFLFITVAMGAIFVVVLTGIFCCEQTRKYEHFQHNNRNSRSHTRNQQQKSPPTYHRPPTYPMKDSQF